MSGPRPYRKLPPNPRRKLTADNVREIRAANDRNWPRVSAFAVRFNVAPAVILQVIDRVTYREVQ